MQQTVYLYESELDDARFPEVDVAVVVLGSQPLALVQTLDYLRMRAEYDATFICVQVSEDEDERVWLNRLFERVPCEFLAFVKQGYYPGRSWLKTGLRRLIDADASLLAFNDGIWRGKQPQNGLVHRARLQVLQPGVPLFDLGLPDGKSREALVARTKAQGQFLYAPESVLFDGNVPPALSQVPPVADAQVLELALSELHAHGGEASTVDVVIPTTDLTQARRCAFWMAQRAGAPARYLLLRDDARVGVYNVLNRAFAALGGDYFVWVPQDSFASQGWLRLALDRLQATDKGLLAFNDGKWSGQIATTGMLRRAWVMQACEHGLPFHAGYASHFGDNEVTLLARERGAFLYAPNVGMFELDWGKQWKRTNLNDAELFKQRRSKLMSSLVAP